MTPAMRFPAINNKAFTMLELIVVMVLIAITVSLSVPKFANFLYTDQLKVTARRLVGLINQSSQLAQRHQTPYLLIYIVRERRFVVEPEQKEDERYTVKNDGRLELVESVTLTDFWSWYGGIHSSEEYIIRFNKNGYVEPTVIHLRDEGGREMSLVLSPFLGKVQIVDSYVVPDKDAAFL
jgi:prepilin-type N-terminal cleavage/methylation domain-containing protein